MSPTTMNPDQSDRSAYPWAVAEPGSWSELCESMAFLSKSGGLALHPVSIVMAAVAALAASWALPLHLVDLLPWQGETGAWATLWAWARLTWLVGVGSIVGVALARVVAARPSRAEVWGVLPSMLGSAGLCVSTYVATLGGLMLATWLAQALGEWIGGPFGVSLASMIGFLAMLGAWLSTFLLALAIPSIAANDADAPDAMQRAAAHLLARPGLSLLLLSMAMMGSLAAAGLANAMLTWSTGWIASPEPGGLRFRWFPSESGQIWLPHTLWLFVLLALGWAALTQALLTLREVVDREDRASCWDPKPQALAIRQAIQARAIVGHAPDQDAQTPEADDPDQT